MKASIAVAVLFGVLLCSSCSQSGSPTAPSSAPPATLSASSQGAKLVPFKGSFEGTQTFTPGQFPFASVNGSATGTATHLGRFTVEFPHTVNVTTRTGGGTYTFTAANGDTLNASFTGQAEGTGVVSIVEHAKITGGTGRFAGATGTFTVVRQFVQATGTTEGSFEGTISSVGAGKR